MARTELTKTIRPGGYSGTGTQLVSTAADTTNQNSFVTTGNEIVIAENTDAGSQTVTINSVDDKYNRKEDISAYSIPAGETHIFGPFPLHGWQQSDGSIYLEASSTNVNFKIIQL